jgi:chromate transport protein ChrA
MLRTPGGLAPGTLFILPGALVVLALSVTYATLRDVTWVAGLFDGLEAVVLAIVIEALVRVGKRALRTRAHAAVAVASFASLFFFDMPFPVVVAVAALADALGGRWAPEAFPGGTHVDGKAAAPSLLDRMEARGELAHAAPSPARAARVLVVSLAPWALPFLLAASVAGTSSVYFEEATFFSQLAMVTFGGAYAVLSYVAQRAVGGYGWLSAGEMVQGLGLAETTPGPLILVVQFVGFMGAYHDAGPLPPLVAGLSEPTTLIYASPGACFGITPFVDRTAVTGTASYWLPDGTEQTCRFLTAGITPDFGMMGTAATLCSGVTALPAGIGDFAGPVTGWNVLVPTESSQTSISAEALYFVYGFGPSGGVSPWTVPGQIFGRNATSAAQIALGLAIDVPPERFVCGLAGSGQPCLDVRTNGAMILVVVVEPSGARREAVTDVEGRFSFEEVAEGEVEVAIEGERVTRVMTHESLARGEALEVTYDVSVEDPENEAEDADDLEIVVQAPPLRRAVVSTEVRAEEARLVPGTSGDVVRVVESLPGVARASAGTGVLIAWGAAPDETRIYVDGVPIPRLMHEGGLRSVVQPDTVRAVELVPGGCGAGFGRGLGGLVSVRTETPAGDGAHGALALDVLDASALVRGAVNDDVRLAVSARVSLFDLYAEQALGSEALAYLPIPRYRDGQARARFSLGPGESLELVGMLASDRFTRGVPNADPSLSAKERRFLDFQRVYARYVRERGDGSVVTVTPFAGADRRETATRNVAVVTSVAAETLLAGLRASYRAHVAGATQAQAAELRQRRRPNRAPEIETVFAQREDGSDVLLDPSSPLVVRAGETIMLEVGWPACPEVDVCGDGICRPDETPAGCSDDCGAPSGCAGAERFVRFDPESRGIVVEREAMRVAWYTTAGRFEIERSGRAGDDPKTYAASRWEAPEAATSATLWMVVRDARGGVGWTERRIEVVE